MLSGRLKLSTCARCIFFEMKSVQYLVRRARASKFQKFTSSRDGRYVFSVLGAEMIAKNDLRRTHEEFDKIAGERRTKT